MHGKLSHFGVVALFATTLTIAPIPAAATSGCLRVRPPVGPDFLDCSGARPL